MNQVNCVGLCMYLPSSSVHTVFLKFDHQLHQSFYLSLCLALTLTRLHSLPARPPFLETEGPTAEATSGQDRKGRGNVRLLCANDMVSLLNNVLGQLLNLLTLAHVTQHILIAPSCLLIILHVSCQQVSCVSSCCLPLQSILVPIMSRETCDHLNNHCNTE